MPTAFTVQEIRDALAQARENIITATPANPQQANKPNADPEFQELIKELARNALREERTLHRVSRDDLEMYLQTPENQPCEDELCEHRQDFFEQEAKKYIDDSETLAEAIKVCLDSAHYDAQKHQCGCP